MKGIFALIMIIAAICWLKCKKGGIKTKIWLLKHNKISGALPPSDWMSGDDPW